MKKIPRFITLLVAVTALLQSASALPADLDLTFNGSGKVTTAIGSNHDEAGSVAIQNDGKIVVAGEAHNGTNIDFAVVRYNTNGDLDTTFNGTGLVTTAIGSGDDRATSVAMQSNGKIVVAGTSHNGTNTDFAVVRYNADGTLDTTFNGTGKLITAIGNGDDNGSCVVVQRDGKIVVGGSSFVGSANTGNEIAIVRYNNDGSLDTAFGGTGKVTTPVGIDAWCLSVALQDDGKLLASGTSVGNDVYVSYDFAVLRYNTNGSLDTTFNGTGKVITAFGGAEGSYSVAVQDDGKIVAVGRTNYNNPDFILARYNTNGSLDSTFGGTGKVATDFGFIGDFALCVAVQRNGRIIVAGVCHVGSDGFGNTYVGALARYNANGSLDSTFNGTGKDTTAVGRSSQWNSVAIQRDGKIVVAGWSDSGDTSKIVVARYLGDLDTDSDGLLDWFETGTGTYVSPEDTGSSPTNPDSDGDGLSDGVEVNTHQSNPNLTDTDEDGFFDEYEVLTGKSPVDDQDKPALVAEARTAIEFTFPAALGKTYRIESSLDLATWGIVESGIAGNGGQIQRFYSTRNVPKRYFRVEEDSP